MSDSVALVGAPPVSGSPVSLTLTDQFASAMARLGPFEPHPRLAAAVSGGADSTALALLGHTWARDRRGSLLALIVDHGLRPDSAAEAALTSERLSARGVPVRRLHAAGLFRGSAMAERARAARYRLLTAACAEAGILHLLLGHHAGDQAETLMIRVLGNSGDRGLAAMPELHETASLRLLRPLLLVPPGLLRDFLSAVGMQWVEDPSNRDPRALRGRLRQSREGRRADADNRALCAAAIQAGVQRSCRDRALASALLRQVHVRAEGFAVLAPGPVSPDVLMAVIQTIAGAPYPPASAQIAALAADPRPATVAGVRLLPAGRLGPGLLLVREAEAMAPCVPAEPGAVWDGRFRLAADAKVPAGATLGPLGLDAARLRRQSPLPSVVLQTLPALRLGKVLAVIPHLLYPDSIACAQVRLVLNPPRPFAGAPFFAAPTASCARKNGNGDEGWKTAPYVGSSTPSARFGSRRKATPV